VEYKTQSRYTHKVRACAVPGLLRALSWGHASLLVLICEQVAAEPCTSAWSSYATGSQKAIFCSPPNGVDSVIFVKSVKSALFLLGRAENPHNL
jgi:hypothetical protein